MKFTLKQLRYFVAAGDTGSIKRAAEQIHVSQASVSSAIHQIEQQFGMQLFTRQHARGLSLTTKGRIFFREARELLSQAQQLQRHAGELADTLLDTIEIVFFNPLAATVMPELCHAFMHRYPGVSVHTREAHQVDIINLLRRRTVELAITYDLQLQSDLDFIPLARLEPYVLLAKTHPLAAGKSISLPQVADEKLILLDLPLSNDYFMSLFRQAGVKPIVAARTQQIEALRGLVARGHGYSLANIRPVNRHSLAGRELAYVKLQGRHEALSMGIALLKNQNRSAALDTFIDFTRQQIEQYGIPGMSPIR